MTNGLDQPLPALLAEPRFVTAAHDPVQWPPDTAVEVAFAGRSNVGKSSALNRITQRQNLARTSKTPGRTQQIVFFQLGPHQRLVDLPGYGYAKVPKALRRHWDMIIERYLTSRHGLAGLFLLMDIRHPLTPLDQQMLGWCQAASMPVHVLLTKCDKLSRGNAASAMLRLQRTMTDYTAITVQSFSATTGTGLTEARDQLVQWLGGNKKTPETKGDSGA